ncbi:hypothetical protein JOB18_043971 [Solea senegalensis]|uniref:Uncharacterized protein n=1 Tax=Solea senegalensis TaxID=28829 RepID=A0AAV6PKN7_SOLSE|nr:hypothetical protein JOB18_043971 [Solea senegalensis]
MHFIFEVSVGLDFASVLLNSAEQLVLCGKTVNSFAHAPSYKDTPCQRMMEVVDVNVSHLLYNCNLIVLVLLEENIEIQKH